MTTKAIEAGARAFKACRPIERTACQDFGMQQDDILHQQLEAAFEAAIASGELVPASAVAAERERATVLAEAINKLSRVYWSGPDVDHRAVSQAVLSIIAETDKLRAIEPASGEYVLGWRTMDSAPKDGTIILLWYPWTGADLEGAPDGFMYLARWTYKEDGSEAWIDPTDDDEIGDGAIRWMPRPTPPPLTAATSNGSGK